MDVVLECWRSPQPVLGVFLMTPFHKVIWYGMFAFFLALFVAAWMEPTKTSEEIQKEKAYWQNIEEQCRWLRDHGGPRTPRKCLGHIK